MDRSQSLVVAAGGAIGATARWAVIEQVGLHAFPWALLIVNAVGSFVLGLVAFRAAGGRRELVRLGVGVGFCGGLTTFSGFAVAAAELGRDERLGTAVSYVTWSLVIAVAAIALGATVRRRLDPAVVT